MQFFAGPGTYKFLLTVTDAAGRTATKHRIGDIRLPPELALAPVGLNPGASRLRPGKDRKRMALPKAPASQLA